MNYIGFIMVMAGVTSMLLLEKSSPPDSCGGSILMMGIALIGIHRFSNEGNFIGWITCVGVGLCSMVLCVDNYMGKRKREENKDEQE